MELSPKIITMYLPQFHRVKENDEWWGEGFTEWTTVKKAEILYEGHYQPRKPLNDNYYDLMDKSTMEWQAELMQKYGVDAQCFYHYWFKDGRQILEKPAENLLQWKNIDMPFCFCWANETWARTWSKIRDKNSWASTFEKKAGEKNSGILLEQKYGDEKQWKQHFDYLINFFKDERYIKVDNRPVFLIYKTALIPCLNQMIDKWNEWAQENDFDGIFLIGANSNRSTGKCLDAVLYHEPQYSMRKLVHNRLNREELWRLEYDSVWEEVLGNCDERKNVIYEGFVGYDDTPRRGKDGVIIENLDPERFRKYLSELIAKNIADNNPLIFINAWNEWGEGMYLEPDEKHGYAYLEAIKFARNNFTKYLDKYESLKRNSSVMDNTEEQYDLLEKKCARYEEYWRILDEWLCLKEEQIPLEKYFQENEIDSIAIYGMGMLGKHLLKELEKSSIKIKYGIDRAIKVVSEGIKMYSPSENLPEVDAIVVTATYDFYEIKAKLQINNTCKIISLEDIVFWKD